MLRPLERLPRGVRVVVEWVGTIVAAIAIVLAVKTWIVNPYRIPSPSMEPTLHCARPAAGCRSRFSDRVLANRFIYHFREPRRGDLVVFETPTVAQERCGAGGTYVKRLIGLPGEVVSERGGVLYVDGKRLDEPYVRAEQRGRSDGGWKVPAGRYFMMGDNRRDSCDSRVWGAVPRGAIIGEVFAVYWPLTRLSLR